MHSCTGRGTKLSNLDLLRAVAVLCVLVDHIAATFGVGRQYGFFDLGQLGVLLFFVHTSLVLMQSLERQFEAPDRGGVIPAFYIRRLFRIYPLSILAVCVTCLLHIPPAPWTPWHGLSPHAIASSVLLVSNLTGADPVIGPLWSLPLELQMYVTLPALYLMVRRASKLRLAGLWTVCAIAGFLQIELAKTGHAGIWRLNLLQYAPCFLSGVIAYRLLHTRNRHLPSIAWPFGLLGSGVLFLAWQMLGHSHDRFPPYRGWVCCLIAGLLLPTCRDCTSKLFNRICSVVAKYSYGIYLFQGMILWLAFKRLPALPVSSQIAIFAMLMLAVPVALFHIVEQPAIRLGGYLAAAMQRTFRSTGEPAERDFRESLVALNTAIGRAVTVDQQPVPVSELAALREP